MRRSTFGAWVGLTTAWFLATAIEELSLDPTSTAFGAGIGIVGTLALWIVDSQGWYP